MPTLLRNKINMKQSLESILGLCVVAVLFIASHTHADPWPQFRGPDGTGISTETQRLPADIAPNKHVIWKVDVIAGVSSPVVVGGRIYLTGDKGKGDLVTFALNATDGSLVWEKAAPITGIETTDKKPAGRLATPTIACDGKHVVSFFGSSGLICYSLEGEQLWYRAMGPFENRRGASSSPVIHEGKVILYQDHEVGSFIEAIDINNGKTIWRTERSLFNRSYGTPLILKNAAGPDAKKDEIIVVGSGLVTSYDFNTGKLNWFVKGTSAVTNPMAVAGSGKLKSRIFVASANPGPKREFQPDFAALTKQRDKNADGKLAADELPTGLFAAMFPEYDANNDRILDEDEYQAIQTFMRSCRNGMIAIDVNTDDEKDKTGKRKQSIKDWGIDRTDSHKRWSVTRSTPRTATPIYHDGHLYMINDGGIFTSLNAATGEVVKSERIPAKGKVFSSPVLADGKIFVADDRGQLVVLGAKPQWEQLAEAKFDEPVYPTPAIVGGRIYLRTETKLYCFGVGVN